MTTAAAVCLAQNSANSETPCSENLDPTVALVALAVAVLVYLGYYWFTGVTTPEKLPQTPEDPSLGTPFGELPDNAFSVYQMPGQLPLTSRAIWVNPSLRFREVYGPLSPPVFPQGAFSPEKLIPLVDPGSSVSQLLAAFTVGVGLILG